MSDPIVMGTYSGGTYTYNDSRNNSSYGNDYGQPSPDIFYRFTVQGATQVNISTCSSSFDTYLHLLDGTGGLLTFDDDNGPVCSGVTASISIPNATITSLPAGTYYIVAEGYGTNTGIINLTVNLTVQGTIVYDTRNFIRTWEATAPESDQNNLITRPLNAVKQSTTYFDGLGRPEQSLIKQGSLSTAGNSDIVTPFEYDNLGRQVKKYLPYVAGSSDGLHKDNAFVEQNGFYTGVNSPVAGQGESYFYAQNIFESSPLNRVEKQMAPGISWVGGAKGVEAKYWVNTSIDAVRLWNVTDEPTGFGIYSSTAAYAVGQLFKNATVDENGKQVIEFKDKEGKVILKKVQLTATSDDGTGRGYAGWLCTYYVYDDLGNLRCVIQPEGVKTLASNSWSLTTGVLNEQCFRYEYDARNRMIRKKVPGAGEIWMVYDARDRLVMNQDSNLRSQHKWVYTVYDNDFNRPVSTGLLTDPSNYNNLSYHLQNAYSSISYPNLANYTTEELTKTFYDDYTWLAGYGNPLPSDYANSYDTYFQPVSNTNWPYPQPNIKSGQTKGLITGIRTKILGTTTYLYSVTFYDPKGRPIQVQSSNITGGTDITTTQYTWAGQPLVIIQKQQKSGTNAQVNTIVTQLTYDDLGRVVKNEKKVANTLVNGGTMSPYKTTSQLQYDALGQLKTKKLGTDPNNTSLPLENLVYDYNIRGWLLGANRDYAKDANNNNWFGFDLGYDKANNGIIGGQTYANPQYNGNIEGMVWKSKGDGEKRKYDFTYDAVNRLTGADFNQYTSSTFNKTAGIDFSVSSLAYDGNGNILTLNQKAWKLGGSTFIDQLSYTYQPGSNKLQQVSDASNDNTSKLGDFKYDPSSKTSTDYSYDGNGNLVIDNNKKISSITYNYLNLPSVITVTGKGTITYTYDASGNKLKKEVNETGHPLKTTLYMGGAVYENDTLQFIAHEEGRIRFNPQTGAFAFDYFLKDHLGNVRMVLTDQQQQDIYPASTLEGDINNSSTAAGYEKQFYSIDASKIVNQTDATGIPAYQNNNGIANPYPSGNSGNTNYSGNSQRLYKLNATSNKTGLGIVLKVMSGDKLDIFGRSYYFQNNSGDTISYNLAALDIANGLLGSPQGSVTAGHGVVTANDINNISGASIGTFLTNSPRIPYTSSTPRAYINYIILDEQFKYVSGGFSAVGANSQLKQHHDDASMQNISVTKNGYVYIYVSDESPVNVFFDNLQVVHTRGPLVEETHYYPFGLTMAGISSKAMNFGNPENKRKWNKGSELESKEFSDGSGLELYSTQYRSLDPQIGRFWQIDPRPDYSQSLYSSMSNNPISFNDPLGDSINNPRDQRTAARIEASINRKITSNNQSITNSQTKITANNAKLTKLRADVASGSLTGKDLKSANKEIGKLEKSNASANTNITEMQGQNAQLNQSLGDIANLRNDVNFNYTFGGAPGFGSNEHGVLRGSGNNVIIQGSDDGLYVHEIRHIGQSMANGGLRFSTNSATLGRLINAGSPDRARSNAFEVDTYQAQFSFDRNSYPAPGGARVLSDINLTSLRTIIGDSGGILY